MQLMQDFRTWVREYQSQNVQVLQRLRQPRYATPWQQSSSGLILPGGYQPGGSLEALSHVLPRAAQRAGVPA